MTRTVKPIQKSDEKGALTLIEEAAHMLRQAPVGVLARYYIGTLPFVLGLLYFWADMSRDAFASQYCSIAALGIAILYVWMKSWQVAFVRGLGVVLPGGSPPPWTPRRALVVATKQAAIHSTGPFVLPIAMLMTLPFAWVFAFYQNASVLDEGERQGLRTLWRQSWKQASLAPKQNHLLLAILFLFELFVFLNLAVGVFQAPHLLKTFLGIETVFTLSGYAALNTTYFAVVCGLTHLCVDPILKTVYALRCYYGASMKTGDDIRVSLKRHASSALLVGLTILSFPMVLSAQPSTAAGPEAMAPIHGEKARPPSLSRGLDESIERVLKRREFAWRMPREKTEEEEPESNGMLDQFLEWLEDVFSSVFKTLKRWWDALEEWLETFLPEPEEKRESAGWAPSVRTIFYLFCFVAALALGAYLLRLWKKRPRKEKSRREKLEPAVPDLMDENIEADALPSNRWLELASEFMDKGAFRRGLRALYLAILAHLAEHERITIAKYKSNREYDRELTRRAHADPELLRMFSTSVTSFEKAWYGMHTVTRKDLDRFVQRQERIMAMVS